MKLKFSIISAFLLLFLTTFFNKAFGNNTIANNLGLTNEALLWVMITVCCILLMLIIVFAKIIKGLTSNTEIWKKTLTKNQKKGVSTLFFILGFTALAYSQNEVSAASNFIMSNNLFYALLSLIIVLLVVCIYLYTLLNGLIKTLNPNYETDKSWAQTLTDSVPIEKENEIMTDHVYDGIRELDNNLPPWWVWGFYATIVFSIGYLFYFEYMGGPSSTDEYNAAMNEAQIKKELYMANMANAIDENNVTLITDASRLDKGKDIYINNCAACHGQGGEGGVGPNFADNYWIHGGSINDIFKTIKYGVPAKGMIAWESQLSPSQMQDVASYIATFKGTNPPNPKEPQGELYEPETATDSSVNENLDSDSVVGI